MWLVLALLLTARGLLAAVEAALQALSDDQVKALAKEFPRRGGRLQALKGDVEATAAAIRSAMVLLGFTAAAIGVLVPPKLLDVAFRQAVETSEWVLWMTPLVSALLVAMIATVVDVSSPPSSTSRSARSRFSAPSRGRSASRGWRRW